MLGSKALLVDETFDDDLFPSPDAPPLTGVEEAIRDGVYHARFTAYNTRAFITAQPLENFIAETSCRIMQGEASGSCGIVFARDLVQSTQYSLLVNGNGRVYAVGQQGTRGDMEVTPNREGGYRLRVVRMGGRAQLFVNETLVQTLDGLQVASGAVGVEASSSSTSDTVEVTINELKIWSMVGAAIPQVQEARLVMASALPFSDQQMLDQVQSICRAVGNTDETDDYLLHESAHYWSGRVDWVKATPFSGLVAKVIVGHPDTQLAPTIDLKINESMAGQLERGQKLVFSGEIDGSGAGIFGCTVTLRDVVIHS
jgi:hypothetical protein